MTKPPTDYYLDRLLAAKWGDVPQPKIPPEVMRAAIEGREVPIRPESWRPPKPKRKRRRLSVIKAGERPRLLKRRKRT